MLTRIGSLARMAQLALFAFAAGLPSLALAQERHGGETTMVFPDLSTTTFEMLGGVDGRTLLLGGIGVCVLGLIFGVVIFSSLKNLPVHPAMREISELIYETCKTYVATQARFIAGLQVVVAVVLGAYFGYFAKDAQGEALGAAKVVTILVFSVLGIVGSVSIAWFGMRVNTFANSRASFASLEGKPFPVYAIPLRAGMSIGMVLVSLQLLLMLAVMLFMPADYAGPCFIGLAIGESLGASALRIAGGIFTKIADIGSDLMKIVFKIKEDDARNPGVIADCAGDNAGDSVGPSAGGFETYGVTGVALVSFILLAVKDGEGFREKILVWMFTTSVVMIIASALSYFVNEGISKALYGNLKKMDFEAPLTNLIRLTSLVSIGFTFLMSYLLISDLGEGTYWWKFATIISCGIAAGAIIPELIKVFTSTTSAHVREVVASSKEGGASLNVISGMTAGNFSAYWMGITLIALMGIAYYVTRLDPGTGAAISAIMTINNMDVSPVFAFGLVAFGFLGMGPVTIAVDSYGPVTDNAQSVYELSLIEQVPNVAEEIKKIGGFDVNFDVAKELLEENDGAGNTFKATAKPVLIGTAVVGATTMIFSIIVVLTGLQPELLAKLSILHPPFLLGLLAGGAVIYWFTGAANHAVAIGAYRAVEFIKANMKLTEGVTKASVEDSKKVVAICTEYAQKGMLNIFFALFLSTLAFAFLESYFFIGYLITIALCGLFQALFLANAGGAWDNAKKVVETELKMKGTPLHDACVVGDTVGDPFKDTSSVAMNPVIKFTTLFGLIAVELAEQLGHAGYADSRFYIALFLFVGSTFFVARSFYGMRIENGEPARKPAPAPAE